jgi:hypothetical protein
MTLLKGDGTVPSKLHKTNVIAWPEQRMPEGIGLSVKDGWYMGIGFGLAMTVAVPFILLLGSVAIGVMLLILSVL